MSQGTGERGMVRVVDQLELTTGLRRLGIGAGDVVLVHSSLRSFGHVTGGAPTVVRALLEVIGERGTLVAPIFRRYFWEGPDQVWDRQRSPSLMGAVSEAVRTWPGALPSRHAPHPVAAIGPQAADLAARRNRTDFSFDSPFARLLELDAWIVLLGVDFARCTFIHLLEQRVAVPYRHWQDLSGTVVDEGVAQREVYPFFRCHEGVQNDFAPLGKLLTAAGKVRRTRIGAALVRAMRANDLYEAGLRALGRDPLVLVSAGTREAARRFLPDHGSWIASLGTDPGQLWTSHHPVAHRLAACLHVRRSPGPPMARERLRWATDDGLSLREMELQGGPSPAVPAMLALPAAAAGPLPAVICLPGTGGSWERTMEAGLRPRDASLLGWGRQLAREGFAVLALTQLNHPPRPEPWNWEWPKLLQPFGQSAMGRLVADVCFAVDYLRTVPQIDAERIAVAGFSLGGIAAFYGHAVDARLRAAAIFCGGVGSVAEQAAAGRWDYHSVYYYVPGLVAGGMDHPQLVPTLAPRPLLLCATAQDQGMPLGAVQRFADAARAAYVAAGAAEAFELRVDPGPHAMRLDAFRHAAAWLRRHLLPAPEADAATP